MMNLDGLWNCTVPSDWLGRNSVFTVRQIALFPGSHHMVIVTKQINTLCWIIKDWQCDCALCTNIDLMSWVISSRLASQSMTLPWLLCLRLWFPSSHQRSMAHSLLMTLRGPWLHYGWESTHYNKWAKENSHCSHCPGNTVTWPQPRCSNIKDFTV